MKGGAVLRIIGAAVIAVAVLAAMVAIPARRWPYGFIPDPMLRARRDTEWDRRYDEALRRLLASQSELTVRRENVVKTQRVLAAQERIVRLLEQEIRWSHSYDRDKKEALRKAIALAAAARLEASLARRSAFQASTLVASRLSETTAARRQWEASFVPEAGDRGALVQQATLLVMFRNDTPRAELQDVLERNRLAAASKIPIISLYVVTSLDPPQSTTEAETTRLRALIARLEESPWVESAVQNTLLTSDYLTTPDPRLPRLWLDPNVLILDHHVQAWNFKDAMTTNVAVGVLDEGFSREGAYPDIPLTPAIDPPAPPCVKYLDLHGTLVAGVIGAKFDDGKGTDGGAPNVTMYKCSPQPATCDPNLPPADQLICRGGALSDFMDGLGVLLKNGMSVVNASISYHWSDAGIIPAASRDVQKLVKDQGELVRKTMASYPSAILVSSAGNDTNQPAVWASPFNWAALGGGNPSDNVIVAEAMFLNGNRLTESNTDASIKAYGQNVLAAIDPSTNGPLYCEGTSGAAPLVASTVAMIRSVGTSKTAKQIREDCFGIATGTTPELDAFTAVSKCVANPERILSDLDNDQDVDDDDFKRFRDVFRTLNGQAGPHYVRQDLNGDTRIDEKDLDVMGTAMGLNAGQIAELKRRLRE